MESKETQFINEYIAGGQFEDLTQQIVENYWLAIMD